MATQGKNTPVPKVHGMDIVTALINLETYYMSISLPSNGPKQITIPHEDILLFRNVLNYVIHGGMSEHERACILDQIGFSHGV